MSQGSGMCGHKNSYSSNVRYGNWNEDKFGTEILSTREVPNLSYDTEYTANHRDPKTVSLDPRILSIKMESLEEIRGKNKDGLSYNLIFQHGEHKEPPAERFSTTSQQANKHFDKYSLHEKTFTTRREKQLSKEMLDLTTMTTETRKANTRLNTPATSRIDSGTLVVNVVQPESLPRWNRRSVSKI
mmetsp:Transcript_24341/g.24948  ORF Transcript_24341/g.24948 Transcript_24341/m.24948 type:complete len:186 (+) Transcript_24341:93-650(+)